MFKHIRSGAQTYGVDVVSRETGRDVFEDDIAIATGMPPDRCGSRTIQSAKDDADINVIVKRFGVTGQLPAGVRMPSYGDYNGVSDFQSAMNVIREAEESFMMMPAEIRSQFGNDPQAFLEYCSDPENIDSLRKMGLANPAPKVDTGIEPVIPPVKEKANERGSTAKRAEKADKASAGSESSARGESEGS